MRDKKEVKTFITLLKKLSPAQQAGFNMMIEGAAVIALGKKKRRINRRFRQIDTLPELL